MESIRTRQRCVVLSRNPGTAPLRLVVSRLDNMAWAFTNYFYRLEEARQHLNNSPDQSLKIFSKESHNSKRQFSAISSRDFWDAYQTIREVDRNYYEIILEEESCKLYLDIDISRTENTGFTIEEGNHLVQSFIEEVLTPGCEQLLENDFDLTEEDILWLDSSSERKFSVHLVVPKLVFSSNQVVKIFLETLCHSLSQEHQERFTFNEKLMVDTKCYSRNQNFRILHSSKFGKNSHLRVGDQNKFPLPRALSCLRPVW